MNIEAAQISQTTDGTDAIMLLRVDRAVDPGVLEPIGASIGARDHAARLVRLTGADHRTDTTAARVPPGTGGCAAGSARSFARRVSRAAAGLLRTGSLSELIDVQRGTRACALRSSRATASGRRSSTRR